MSTKKKPKISQVFDRSLIPDGYVRNTKNQERGYLFSNYVGKEIHAGRALAILFGGDPDTGSGHGGAFYVHPEHMQRLQQEWDARKSADQCADTDSSDPAYAVQLFDGVQTDAAVTALCEINNGLAVIGDTLRDLVAAVQLLAEQQSKQHEPVGTWRDMNGEAL